MLIPLLPTASESNSARKRAVINASPVYDWCLGGMLS